MALREKLIAAGTEKLADILLLFWNRYKDIKKDLNFIVAEWDDDPKKIVTIIRKEINALKRYKKFISCKETVDVAKRLDRLRSHIATDLLLKSPKAAFDFMLEFLDLHEGILFDADDSGGRIADVFCEACVDLDKLAVKADVLITELVEIAYTKIVNDPYCVYNRIIRDLKNSLRKEGLLKLKSKCLSFHEGDSDYRKSTLENALKEIDECIKGIDLLNTQMTDSSSCSSRLEEHKTSEECMLRFKRDLSFETYKEMISLASEDAKVKYKNEANLLALSYEDPYKAISFLRNVKEFGELSKLVRLKHTVFDGSRYKVLRPAAKQLEKSDPLAATLLYRKMIENIVAKSYSRYYNFAAKDLVNCNSLNSKITDWECFCTHDEYFKDIKSKHKLKKTLWEEYDYELEELALLPETLKCKRRKLS